MTANGKWRTARAREAFAAHRARWDAVNQALHDRHPLLDSRFVGPLIEHFADERLVLAGDLDGDCPQFALCAPRRALHWASFLPGQAPISPVLLSSPPRVAGLMRALSPRAVALDLLSQDPLYSPFGSHACGPGIELTDHALTTSIDLTRGFEAYWRARSRKLRQNVQRYLRRARKAFGEIELRVVSDPGGVHGALERYGLMESAGWKGAAGTAIHIDNAQGRFYSDVLRAFAEPGNAGFYELYYRDRFVASRFAISNDDILVMLKTTYDEGWSSFAPGRILLYLLLQHEFERNRFRSVEFYTNAAPELVGWSTDTRMFRHVTLYSPPLLARASRLYQGARRLRAGLLGGRNPKHAISPSFETRCVKFRHFSEIPASGARLLKASSQSSVFKTRAWFDNFVEHVASKEGEVQLYCSLLGNGKVSAVMPLWRRRHEGGLEPRVLQSLASSYSGEYSPVMGVDGGAMPSPVHALVQGLKADAGSWDVLSLMPVDPLEPWVGELETAFREAGLPAIRRPRFVNWYLPCKGLSYADYLAQRPSRLRNTLERRRRKLDRERIWRVRVFTSFDGIGDAMRAYETVYERSWKHCESSPEFVRGLIRLCAQHGWLRLGVLYIHGIPASAQLWIAHARVASIYKLAFDPRFASYSVGSLLTAHMMEHVLDRDRVETVDYLTGDDAYKRDWMTHRRERVVLSVYNVRTVKGRLHHARRVAGDAVRRVPR